MWCVSNLNISQASQNESATKFRFKANVFPWMKRMILDPRDRVYLQKKSIGLLDEKPVDNVTCTLLGSQTVNFFRDVFIRKECHPSLNSVHHF